MRSQDSCVFERSRYARQCACPQIYLIIAIGQNERMHVRKIDSDKSLIRCLKRKKIRLIRFICVLNDDFLVYLDVASHQQIT